MSTGEPAGSLSAVQPCWMNGVCPRAPLLRAHPIVRKTARPSRRAARPQPRIAEVDDTLRRLVQVLHGTYDKISLPGELIMTSYFSIRDGKIVSLAVIINRPSRAKPGHHPKGHRRQCPARLTQRSRPPWPPPRGRGDVADPATPDGGKRTVDTNGVGHHHQGRRRASWESTGLRTCLGRYSQTGRCQRRRECAPAPATRCTQG